MSRNLKFYGASDDLFEVEGTTGTEPNEIGCYGRIPAVKVCNDHGGMIVVAIYDADSLPPDMPECWTIGICPLDEDVPLPGWPMKWSAQGYSTVLEMEVPDDVRVTEIGVDG
jgi:hypothetical protein